MKNEAKKPGPDARQAPAPSLRQRLLWLLLATVGLFALLQGASAYRGALQQADALFDQHLRQMAESMQGRLLPGPNLGAGHDLPLDLLVQIWTADGVPLFRSPNALLPQTAVLGFSDVSLGGRRFRVYTVQSPLQTVQIAQDLSERQEQAQAMAWRAALPVMLLAPLLLLAVWAVVTRSLQPLERTRHQLAQRAADDLSALDARGLPAEVLPLVTELNALFLRVQLAFAAQKRFVADAAHELRSPLAALKLQAQAVVRQGGLGAPAAPVAPAAEGAGDGRDGTMGESKADRKVDALLLQRLQQGIDRSIQLVEQLLALARAESAPQAGLHAVDLLQLLRLAVADVLPQAQAAGVDIGVRLPEPEPAPGACQVRGDPEALRMLLRNLLDNAIKYSRPTPPVSQPGGTDEAAAQAEPAGRVVLTLAVEAARATARASSASSALPTPPARLCLTVDDNGPGIDPAERSRVFDRFYRSAQARGTQPGSGLGLSIVQAIAQQHGIGLQLQEAPGLGGLRVRLDF